MTTRKAVKPGIDEVNLAQRRRDYLQPSAKGIPSGGTLFKRLHEAGQKAAGIYQTHVPPKEKESPAPVFDWTHASDIKLERQPVPVMVVSPVNPFFKKKAEEPAKGVFGQWDSF